MKKFLILLAVLCPTLVFGQAISYRALNLSQFYSNAYTVGIKSGALLTNITLYGTTTAETFTADTAIFTNAVGNGSGLTNILYAPTASTLFETNAAILTNIVSTLILTNNVRFTNWAAIAVSGQWFQVCLTNSTGNNYYVDVPTNGFTRALTNATGSYVVADASGTNFACLVTNGQRAVLSGKFVGGNLNAGFFHFRHW